MSDPESESDHFDHLQRANVIKELVKTESDYVKDLQVLINTFMCPLEELGIISHNESKIVFSNLLDLLEINLDFLSLLETRVSLSECELSEVCVGDLFQSLAKKLGAYKLYCTNQPAAIEFLNDMKNGSKEFNQFLTACLDDPVCRGLVFQSWLIKPLQRLCKYPLLLRELIKCTPERWKEYNDLRDASVSIDVSVNFVNEEQKKSDLAEANDKSVLEAIQATLVEDKNYFVLIKTGRKVLKKTTMLSTPLEKKEKKPIEVTVYMFSDIFLVLSSYKAAKMRVELNLHYKCMKVADVDYGAGDESKSHSFEVRDSEKNTCLLLFCKNANEKRDWLKDLKVKIKDYQIQRFVQSNSPHLLTNSSTKSSLMSPRLILGSSDIRLNKKDSKMNVFAFPPSEKYQLSCLTSRTALLRRFLTQEEEYISNLWIVLEGFMNPLLEMYGEEFEEELAAIFSYLSEIVDLHQDVLLDPLLVILDSDEDESASTVEASSITGHFLTFFDAEHFDTYELYFENFRDRHKLQKSLTESLSPKLAELSSLIKQIEQEPEPHASIIKGCKLYDLLDIPVKQMYKYAAYFAEFLRLTPEQHEDHAAFLKIAKDIMPKVMDTLEKKIHTHEVVIPNEIAFSPRDLSRSARDPNRLATQSNADSQSEREHSNSKGAQPQHVPPTSLKQDSQQQSQSLQAPQPLPSLLTESSESINDRYSFIRNNIPLVVPSGRPSLSEGGDQNLFASSKSLNLFVDGVKRGDSSASLTVNSATGGRSRLTDSAEDSSSMMTSSSTVLNRQSNSGALKVAVRPSRAMAATNVGDKSDKSGDKGAKRTPILQREVTYSAVVLGQDASQFAKLAQEIERKKREAYLKNLEKEEKLAESNDSDAGNTANASTTNTNTAGLNTNSKFLTNTRSGAKPSIGTASGRGAKQQMQVAIGSASSPSSNPTSGTSSPQQSSSPPTTRDGELVFPNHATDSDGASTIPPIVTTNALNSSTSNSPSWMGMRKASSQTTVQRANTNEGRVARDRGGDQQQTQGRERIDRSERGENLRERNANASSNNDRSDASAPSTPRDNRDRGESLTPRGRTNSNASSAAVRSGSGNNQQPHHAGSNSPTTSASPNLSPRRKRSSSMNQREAGGGGGVGHIERPLVGSGGFAGSGGERNARGIGRQLTNPRELNASAGKRDGGEERDGMGTLGSRSPMSPRGAFNRNPSSSDRLGAQTTTATSNKPSWFNTNSARENPTTTAREESGKAGTATISTPITPRAKLETETTVITLGSQAANLVHLARDIGTNSRPGTLDETFEFNPSNSNNTSPEATTETFMSQTSPTTPLTSPAQQSSPTAVSSPRGGGQNGADEPTTPRSKRGDKKDKEEERKREKEDKQAKKSRNKEAHRDKKGERERKKRGGEKDKQQQQAENKQQQDSNKPGSDEYSLLASSGGAKVPSLGSLAKMLQGLDEFEYEDASVTSECNALLNNIIQNKQQQDPSGGANNSKNNPAKSKVVDNSNVLDPEADIEGFLLTSSLSNMDATFNLTTFTLDNIVDEIFNGDINFDTNKIERGGTAGSVSLTNSINVPTRTGQHPGREYSVATTMRMETEVDFDDGGEVDPFADVNFDTNPSAALINSVKNSNNSNATKKSTTSANSPSKPQPAFRIPDSIELNMTPQATTAGPPTTLTKVNPNSIVERDERPSGVLGRSGNAPQKQQQNNNKQHLQNSGSSQPTQQQSPLKSSQSTQTEQATPTQQQSACENFQPQAFKKNFCLHCFQPQSDHQSNGTTVKSSATTANPTAACNNFQPQTFKKLFCLNCFAHQNEHGSQSTSEPSQQQQISSPMQPRPSTNLSSSGASPLKQHSLKQATAHLERKNTEPVANHSSNATSSPLSASANSLHSSQNLSASSDVKVTDSQQEVIQYLATLDLTKDYAKQIISEGLDKKALLLCTEDDLKSIGFNLGDRKKVLAASKVLNGSESSGSNSLASSGGQPQQSVSAKRLQNQNRNNKQDADEQSNNLNSSNASTRSSHTANPSKPPMIERDVSFRFEQPAVADLNINLSPHPNARYTVFNPERMSDLEKTVDFDDF